ncbi:MAG: BBP7 family outer membrane beta-barrel protein [Pirellulaceae bacterium]
MVCRRVFAFAALLAMLSCAASAASGQSDFGGSTGYVPAHIRAQLVSQTVDWGEADSSDALVSPNFPRTPRLWAKADYLLWWTKGVKAPPLATTSPAGTPVGMAGVLGQPGTTVLFGGEHLHDDTQPGARFAIGGWIDADRHMGVELNYLFLDEDVDLFHATSSQVAVLGRPFFNNSPGMNTQDATLSAFPGTTGGMLQAGATTRFQTLEFMFRKLAFQTETFSIDSVFGYRYAELQDRVRIDSTSIVLSGVGAGARLVQYDDFATRNTFHGGVLGVLIDWNPTPVWSTHFVGKAGLGETRARTSIYGQSVSTTAGGVSTQTVGGLYAQGTNIGAYNQNDFGVFSELGMTLRRQMVFGWSASLGYTFLYWTDVARAGEKIDPAINATQIPPGTLVGPSQPAFPFNESGYWAQGLLFGLDCEF